MVDSPYCRLCSNLIHDDHDCCRGCRLMGCCPPMHFERACVECRASATYLYRSRAGWRCRMCRTIQPKLRKAKAPREA